MIRAQDFMGVNLVMEPFDKPIAQIKKFKIPLLYVGKFVHSVAINRFSRLPACHNHNKKNGAGRNQVNFNSFFFTHKIYQRVLMDQKMYIEELNGVEKELFQSDQFFFLGFIIISGFTSLSKSSPLM
jgi:hypothetical protein